MTTTIAVSMPNDLFATRGPDLPDAVRAAALQ